MLAGAIMSRIFIRSPCIIGDDIRRVFAPLLDGSRDFIVDDDSIVWDGAKELLRAKSNSWPMALAFRSFG